MSLFISKDSSLQNFSIHISLLIIKILNYVKKKKKMKELDWSHYKEVL